MKKNDRKPRKFTKKMRKKLAILFGIILLALIGLNVRLAYINVKDGDKYTKQVLSQRSYDSTTLPFRRGDIIDANGTVLATSEKVYNVVMDCKVINSNEKYVTPTINALTTCFGLSESELRGHLIDTPKASYIVLAKQLTYEEIQPFVEMQNDKENNPYIKGIWFEEEYLRKYPYSSLASSVLGFTVSGNVGNWGIEQEYNEELNGIDGKSYGYLNEDAELERTIKPATDGNTIVSTIDVTIQKIVEKHINAFNETYAGNYREDEDGSTNTAVVVANPQDGSILAMASSANMYDLNNPRDLSKYYSEEEIAGMDEDTKLENLNQIWKNSCITDTFEPGSTIKPITIASGIDSGVITGNEVYDCGSYLEVGGWKIRCVSRYGHGPTSIQQSIMKSCNVVLMQVGLKMGSSLMSKYQKIFGLGKKTGVDLPGEASGILYQEEKMDSSTIATNSFGQNLNVTMVQMVSAFSSLINGGYYYKPHVVSKIVDSNGATVETIDSVLLKQTISNETSEKVKQYLYATVCGTETEGATGRYAHVDGYSMGGKTGTAEKAGRDKENYVISFLGYAPQDNPQVVVYVVIDEPNVEDQAHSQMAQEVAKDIFTEILPYMNIFPTEEKTEEVESTESVDEKENEESTVDTEKTTVSEENTPSEEETDSNSTDVDNEYVGDDTPYTMEGMHEIETPEE